LEMDSGGIKNCFLDNFELRYRIRNNLQIAKNEEASVTIAGLFHEVRSSSPAGFTSRQCPCLLEIREIGKELQLAGVKRCRESLPRRNAACNWNDLEIVTTYKNTPIRRCGRNQQGNLRNEGRPCAAMTGPTRARRHIDRTKILGVTLLRWGTESPVSTDWSRRTLPAVRRPSLQRPMDV
jgi:hypothetical protein